jgi:hypothetical protein
MGGQIVRRLAMTALLLTLALATAVTTANGQGQPRLKANVPFEFIVGDKTLPAGEYAVSALGVGKEVLTIQGTQRKHDAVRLTDVTRPRLNKSAALIFHRYGNTYFLSQVWVRGDSPGWQLLKSRQERAIERELSRIAANRPSKYDEVVVLSCER